jgi:hypothetical protein
LGTGGGRCWSDCRVGSLSYLDFSSGWVRAAACVLQTTMTTVSVAIVFDRPMIGLKLHLKGCRRRKMILCQKASLKKNCLNGQEHIGDPSRIPLPFNSRYVYVALLPSCPAMFHVSRSWSNGPTSKFRSIPNPPVRSIAQYNPHG